MSATSGAFARDPVRLTDLSDPRIIHTNPMRALNNFRDQDQVQPILDGLGLKKIRAEYEERLKLVWCRMSYHHKPSFTLDVLDELGEVQHAVSKIFSDPARSHELEYFVCRSEVPGIFGLGGDLDFFVDCIQGKDRAALLHYAETCIERVHWNWQAMDLPVTTVSLIQGNCLGGAFECALSSNLIVAERSAKIGLPEVLFNLFPGMGAYSFLSRRVASNVAREIVNSGRVYSGQELHERGVVDVLAEDGCGEAALLDHIGQNRSKHGLRHYLDKVERIAHPLEKQELLNVTRLWVERALELTDADLKIMGRLASAQAWQYRKIAPVT